MKLIQSRENPFFKELVKLAGSARQRNKAGQTLLDGAHLLSAYLDAGFRPLHVLLGTSANAECVDLVSCLNDVPVTQFDDKLLAELSELKTTTGILALIEIPAPNGHGNNATPDNETRHARSLTPVPPLPKGEGYDSSLREFHVKSSDANFALLLEDIQDPGNLGSMLRSAAAAGCDAVFLSPGCADAWSPRVLRAAMGGHFCLAIHESQDLKVVAHAFSGTLLATSLQASRTLYECDLTSPVAFMMGNEGAGLSDDLLRLATHPVTIPMPGKVESLNVAAATAICLFEVVRQRC